jgi:hypothetical protein
MSEALQRWIDMPLPFHFFVVIILAAALKVTLEKK